MHALLATVLAGAAIGIGGYTFVYARGTSYATDDPVACSNCHAMQSHFDGWRKGPHHAVAVCNDCHSPAGGVSRWIVKAVDGWHHSSAFTTGRYPDALRLRDASREVVERQCRHCHAGAVAALAHDEVSCVRCHESVGHLR